MLLGGPAPDVDHAWLSRAGIRWIHVAGAGVERWPPALLRGRLVSCGRGVAATAVAEFVIALILAHEKRLVDVLATTPPDRSAVQTLGELAGRGIGILGFGGVGAAVATRLAAFDCHVSALRRDRARGFPPDVRPARNLLDLAAGSHHLVLAAPLTPQTRGIVDDRLLRALPSGAHLVNVARGGLVDEAAVRRALHDGHLSAATLDVTIPEPLPHGHWMHAHPRVRVTGHVAWSAPDARGKLIDRFLLNLNRYQAGRPLLGLVRHGY